MRSSCRACGGASRWPGPVGDVVDRQRRRTGRAAGRRASAKTRSPSPSGGERQSAPGRRPRRRRAPPRTARGRRSSVAGSTSPARRARRARSRARGRSCSTRRRVGGDDPQRATSPGSSGRSTKSAVGMLSTMSAIQARPAPRPRCWAVTSTWPRPVAWAGRRRRRSTRATVRRRTTRPSAAIIRYSRSVVLARGQRGGRLDRGAGRRGGCGRPEPGSTRTRRGSRDGLGRGLT